MTIPIQVLVQGSISGSTSTARPHLRTLRTDGTWPVRHHRSPHRSVPASVGSAANCEGFPRGAWYQRTGAASRDSVHGSVYIPSAPGRPRHTGTTPHSLSGPFAPSTQRMDHVHVIIHPRRVVDGPTVGSSVHRQGAAAVGGHGGTCRAHRLCVQALVSKSITTPTPTSHNQTPWWVAEVNTGLT